MLCVLSFNEIDRRLPLGLQCTSHCYVCHQTMCGAHMMSDRKLVKKWWAGENPHYSYIFKFSNTLVHIYVKELVGY